MCLSYGLSKWLVQTEIDVVGKRRIKTTGHFLEYIDLLFPTSSSDVGSMILANSVGKFFSAEG